MTEEEVVEENREYTKGWPSILVNAKIGTYQVTLIDGMRCRFEYPGTSEAGWIYLDGEEQEVLIAGADDDLDAIESIIEIQVSHIVSCRKLSRGQG